MTVFGYLKFPEIDFTENMSDIKILKFPHCELLCRNLEKVGNTESCRSIQMRFRKREMQNLHNAHKTQRNNVHFHKKN